MLSPLPPALPLGLSTSILPPRALPEGLRYLGDASIPWIEIHGYNRDEFDFGNQHLVAATKEALARFGLQVWSCHSPAYEPLDLSSTDRAVREHTCTVIREAMRVSMQFTPRVFVCDAVAPPRERDTSSARRTLYAGSLQGLLTEARRLGIRLAIENHTDEWGLFVTPDDFLSLVATYGLEGLDACWDTGHGWIAGQPPAAAGRLGTHLVTLHVHDNDGREDLHRAPTRGSIPWNGFVETLRLVGYDGPFMMELVPPESCSPNAIRNAVREAIEVHRLLAVADPQPLEIVEYNPRWPVLFARERDRLRAALGPLVLDIQHIGSTSVPGLAAKPIIDILIGIASYPWPQEAVDAVLALGYEHKGEYGIPRRHYFRNGVPRTHHIHVLEIDSPQYTGHILFRDYVRTHPETAQRYESLKRDLVRTVQGDHRAYENGKSAFIQNVIVAARRPGDRRGTGR